MYLPYLRGRQYELIALRELVEENLIGKNVLPIVEPIKPTSTFIKTIEQYSTSMKEIAVIVNPQVGSFISELEDIKNDEMKNKILNFDYGDYSISSCIMSEDINLWVENLLDKGIQKENLLIINNNKDLLDVYRNLFQHEDPSFVLIPNDRIFNRRVQKNIVLFQDKFEKQRRNADYLEKEDEFFSDDHLFFKDEGYIGFSDYSVVGSDFSVSGFSPYAVAIHIVYFDKTNALRVRHFVSDSNDDISDPARKFYEALRKLIKWEETNNLNTYAMDQFKDLYNNQSYPGLGTVKKLSVMHHIQLINDYLNIEA